METTTRRRFTMTRSRWVSLIGPLAIALGLVVFFGLRWLGSATEESPERSGPPLVQTIQPTEVGQSYRVEARGFVRPEQRVEVVAEVAGKLHYLNDALEVGDTVERGEILFTLDPATFEAELARREAEVARAEALLERAQKERARKVYLAERGGVSESQAELAVADAATREAELAVAKAAVTVARERLRDSVLRAPFDAIIEQENASPGSYVSSNTSVLTLVERGTAEISVGVPQSEAKGVLRAMRSASEELSAEVWIGDTQLTAKLREVAPSLDERSQTTNFELDLTGVDEPGVLLYGSLARVSLPARAERTLYRVKEAAIRKGRYLWRIDDEDTLARVSVEPVRLDGADSLVEGDLTGDEELVLTRLTKEAEGMKVRSETAGSP